MLGWQARPPAEIPHQNAPSGKKSPVLGWQARPPAEMAHQKWAFKSYEVPMAAGLLVTGPCDVGVDSRVTFGCHQAMGIDSRVTHAPSHTH